MVPRLQKQLQTALILSVAFVLSYLWVGLIRIAGQGKYLIYGMYTQDG
jgi:hypothetical protein